jgi:hypothetical protein
MSSARETQLDIEMQLHEVDGSLHQFDLDRRDFLKLLGGGIFICACAGNGIAQESGRMGRSHELPKDISA